MASRKRTRKQSFDDEMRARIEGLFRTYYVEQRRSVTEIMFKLHDDKVANVPEGTLRTWMVKKWNLPKEPRHIRARERSPRHDSATIYPLFKALFEDQTEYYTIDDIVFKIHDKLCINATKGYYQKMMNKGGWKLEHKTRPRIASFRGDLPLKGKDKKRSRNSQGLVEASHSFGDGIVQGNEAEGRSPNAVFPIPDFTPWEFVGDNDNDKEDGDTEEEIDTEDEGGSEDDEGPQTWQIIDPPWSSQDGSRSANANLSLEPPVFSSSDNRMNSWIESYLSSLTQTEEHIIAFLEHGNIDSLQPGHQFARKAYNSAFNAAKADDSTRSDHRHQGSLEWENAQFYGERSISCPTPRLLVSVLAFFSNAYSPKARDNQRHYLRFLHSHSARKLGWDNGLTHLLDFLASPDMDDPDKAYGVMVHLVEVLGRRYPGDFDSNYEAQELRVNAEKNLGNLVTAHGYCDELIEYSEQSSDPAPHQRALRRKGRLFFQESYMNDAFQIFAEIYEAWMDRGAPARMSVEYMVFEDFGKICEFRQEIPIAKTWFSLAASLSDLAHASNRERFLSNIGRSLNSLRIEDLTDRLEKADINGGQADQFQRY